MKKLAVLLAIICILTSFTRKELVWVAIGDSITYLNDHTDETGYRLTKGYMTRVVEKLPHIRYINHGYNGWTSGGIADAIDKLNVPYADVYTIFLGTNDWWQGRLIGTLSDYQNNTGNKTVYGSFRIIIDKLKTLNKNARIILITPMQRMDFVYMRNMKNNAYGSYKLKNGQSLEQFAMALDSIGRYENLQVVDTYHNRKMKMKKLVRFKYLKNPETGRYKEYRYPELVGIPFNPETDEYPYPTNAVGITYDGLHPSDKGNAVIATMLAKIMEKF